MNALPCMCLHLRLDQHGKPTCVTCGFQPGPAFLAARYERTLGLIAALSRDEDEAVYLASTHALVEVPA